jgi:signal peptidase I
MIWIVAAVVVLALAVGLLLLRRLALVITVEGYSMAPTYFDGDRLVVRRGKTCRTGDVVVFRLAEPLPGAPPMLVKRVAAVAGDPIPDSVRPAVGADFVLPGHFVVLGDNSRSLDSRKLGLIPQDCLVGRVTRLMRSPRPIRGPALGRNVFQRWSQHHENARR